MDINKAVDTTLAILFILFLFGAIFIDRLPELYYERYVIPTEVTGEMIRNMSDRDYKRVEWYELGRDNIPYDERIISGERAEILTYISQDSYDLYTFVEHKTWIKRILLGYLGFEHIQFVNDKDFIKTMYFAPDE